MCCDFCSSIFDSFLWITIWPSYWLPAWPMSSYRNQYWASTIVWIHACLICEIFRIFIFNLLRIWIHKHKLNIMVIIWMSLSAHSLISPRNTLRNKVHTKCFCPFFFFFGVRGLKIFSLKRDRKHLFLS